MLYHYHDDYAAEVSKKYGLERGLRAEPGSEKNHQTSEDYNRQLATVFRKTTLMVIDTAGMVKEIRENKLSNSNGLGK